MKLSNVMHCACPTCTARHTAAGCDPIRLPIWSYGSIRASLPRAASMHHSSYYYPTLDTHNTHVLFLGCACYGDLNIPLNHDLIASTVLATPAARRRRPLWRTGFDHIYIYMYIYIYIYTYIHTCLYIKEGRSRERPSFAASQASPRSLTGRVREGLKTRDLKSVVEMLCHGGS